MIQLAILLRSVVFGASALSAFGCTSGIALHPDSEQELVKPAGSISRPDTSGAGKVDPIVQRFAFEGGTQVGTSVKGHPIRLYAWGRRVGQQAIALTDPSLASAAGFTNRVFLFCAIHGSETTTAHAAARLIELIQANPTAAIPEDTAVFLVPIANPDGYAIARRQNASGVDLNRNFPANNWRREARGNNFPGSAPLSEPESRAIHSLTLRINPTRILSLHSIRTRRHGNNFDGPAQSLAELLAKHNGYAVLPTIGYPTPGSFGSWAGHDRQIPTITLEFRAADSNEKAWSENREALLAFIRGK